MAHNFSQTKLAKALGISQPAVAQLVKKGMPTDSLEAASEWRRNNTRSYHRRAPVVSSLPAGIDQAPAAIDPDDPDELAKAKLLCQRTFDEAMRAIDSNLGATAVAQMTTAYHKATQARDVVERMMVARSREAGELMHVDDVRKMVAEKIGQIRSQLDQLPAAVAQDANPADPDHSRAAVERGLEQLMVTISNVEVEFAAVDTAKA